MKKKVKLISTKNVYKSEYDLKKKKKKKKKKKSIILKVRLYIYI